MAISFLKNERTDMRMRDLRFFRLLLALIVLFIIAQVAFPTWRVLPIIYGQDAIPLHYNIHFGVDSVGPWWQIYTVPVIGLVLLIMNAIAARVIWKREPMLSYVIVSATLLLEAILFVSMIFIVLLNISYG